MSGYCTMCCSHVYSDLILVDENTALCPQCYEELFEEFAPNSVEE